MLDDLSKPTIRIVPKGVNLAGSVATDSAARRDVIVGGHVLVRKAVMISMYCNTDMLYTSAHTNSSQPYWIWGETWLD